MKLRSADPQISPDVEHCELCAQENQPSTIYPGFEYHIVQTTEGMVMNLCDLHYYEVATLQ